MSLRSLTVLATSGPLIDVNSVALDGTNEYIDCGNVATSASMSVFIWAKQSAATASLAIVSKWEASDSERSLVIQSQDTDASKIQILLSGNGTTVQKNYRGSQTALSTSGWNLVGFTFNGGTDTLTLYVNGVADATPTKVADTSLGGAIFSSTAKFMIGCISKNGAGSSSAFFNGKVDQVTVFNSALTGAQVLDLYNSPPDDARLSLGSANLVNYWPLGEGTDTASSFRDYVGSNTGTGVNLESGDLQTDIP